MLLDDRKEMRRLPPPREDHRLPEQRPALRSSDIEGVAEAPEIRQGHVVFRGRQGVGQPGAVHVEGGIIAVAEGADPLQLLQGIQRPVFRRLGKIHQAGHDHMLPVFVRPISRKRLFQRLRRHPALRLGNRQHLMAAELDRPGLVNRDMPRFRGHHPLPGAQKRVDHRGVGLGPPHQQEHLRLRAFAGFPDFRPGGFGIGVEAVPRGFFQIGFHKAPEDGRMGPLLIIGREEQFRPVGLLHA